MKVGRKVRDLRSLQGPVALCVAALVGLTITSQAGAATQIGETFTGTGGMMPASYFQIGSPESRYAAPFPGVITSWSFQAAATSQQMKLKIARPAGGNSVTIVGEGPTETPIPNALNTYPIRISVQDGDVLGFFIPAGCFCFTSAPGYTVQAVADDPPPGATVTGGSPVSNLHQDVSATLELDCDGDGFGDETQDPDVSACAPQTTITKGPKDRTRKKTASFEFSSDRVGATFDCSLDDGPFEPCTSPHTLKVKKGKHTFSVRARDAAGNVDGSPASDDWKVKKRKKK